MGKCSWISKITKSRWFFIIIIVFVFIVSGVLYFYFTNLYSTKALSNSIPASGTNVENQVITKSDSKKDQETSTDAIETNKEAHGISKDDDNTAKNTSIPGDSIGTEAQALEDSVFAYYNSIVTDTIDRINSDYNSISTDTINRINSAVTLLAVIATVFAAFGICISYINISAFRDIDKRSAMIEDLKNEINELKVMQHLVLGKMYENLTDNSKNAIYAIKEYEEACKLPNSGIIAIQLINIYSDLFRKTWDERYLNQAIKYAEQKYEEKNDIISGDLYFAEGCLYGLAAKYNSKTGYEDERRKFLQKSIDRFLEAISKNSDDYQYYTNLAITYYYMGDDKHVIYYLKHARICADKEHLSNNNEIDIFNVFEEDAEKIGFAQWNYYRMQVGLPLESKEKFERRVKRAGDNNATI